MFCIEVQYPTITTVIGTSIQIFSVSFEMLEEGSKTQKICYVILWGPQIHTILHDNLARRGGYLAPDRSTDIAILRPRYKQLSSWVTWLCSAVGPEGSSLNLSTSVTAKHIFPNVILQHLWSAVKLLHQQPQRGNPRGDKCYWNAASPSPSITIRKKVPSDCFALSAIPLLLSFNVGTRPDTNEDWLLSFFCRCGVFFPLLS